MPAKPGKPTKAVALKVVKPKGGKSDHKAKAAKPKSENKSGKGGDKKRKEVPKSIKEVRVDRKKSKPNGDLLENLKQLWNSVRERAVDSQVRVDVVERMAKMLKENVGPLALKHDASRVIQFVLQNGKEDVQQSIIEELIPSSVDLSISPYGHFTMLKLLNQCEDARTQEKVARAMKGKFPKVATNVNGARIAEAMLKTFPADVVRTLKVELYAYKSQQLLTNIPESFQEFLSECSDNRRQAALDGMHTLVLKFAKNESLFDFSYVQEILLEFAMQAATNGPEDPVLRDIIDAVSPSIRRIITTRAGAKLGCMVATHGAAKDRKKMLKALKGHALECLCHPSGYLLILKIVESTDDTVSVQKMLLEEVVKSEVEGTKKTLYTATGEVVKDANEGKPAMLTLMNHSSASKLISVILAGENDPKDIKYFDADERYILGLESTTSKKEPNARRREHQQYIEAALMELMQDNLDDLLASDSGARVIMAACRAYAPTDLLSMCFVSILKGAADAAKAWATSKEKTKDNILLAASFMHFSREFMHFIATNADVKVKAFSASALKELNGFASDYTAWVDCNASCHILSSILSVPDMSKALLKHLKGKKTLTALKGRAKTSKVAAALVKQIE